MFLNYVFISIFQTFLLCIVLIINNEVSSTASDKWIDGHEIHFQKIGISYPGSTENKKQWLRNENAVIKSDINDMAKRFKTSIKRMKKGNQNIDVVFLIDSSSSVGRSNFIGEIKFVKKLLTDFEVSFNKTRVGIVTFGSQGKVRRYVDQISHPSLENDKCKLLVEQMSQITFEGGGTYTYGALREANRIFSTARKESSKFIFLVTDGFSNGRNPVPMADKMKSENVTIFTIGIQNGNYAELYNMSSTPHTQHTYLLDSFSQFASLARRALHADYSKGSNLVLTDVQRCNALCDRYKITTNSTTSCCDSKAQCTCGVTSGHYSCMCQPGYYGSGLKGGCFLCPNGTYWHESNKCRPCPDTNHIILEYPAIGIQSCICKKGFRKTPDNHCEGITCPVLDVPENGYFVGQPRLCGYVLNAACGIRCKSGYQLTGTSLRLCQENGTWSGVEAVCSLKTCPSLKIAPTVNAFCKNRDLDLYYDYTQNNQTFAKLSADKTKRKTELMPIDTECIFACEEGYYIGGSRNRNCLPLAKWDGLQTSCKPILCSPLPTPKHGHYELSRCSEKKVPYGTNCTLICPPGFAVKGIETKTCGGKKNGVWSYKHKTHKCIDFEAPQIICPDDYEIEAEPNENFIVVKTLKEAVNISDSSGETVRYWMKPSFNKTKGLKLRIGTHRFSYEAIDSFSNKGKCSFKVTVVDVTPPLADHCVDPESIFYVPNMTESNLISEWEEPTFYDNSGSSVSIVKRLDRPITTPGKYKLIYDARDLQNNTGTCVLNITVKDINCEFLPSPANGQSTCAKNETHTWCELICDDGYIMQHPTGDFKFENIRVHCSRGSLGWNFITVPNCAEVTLPENVEHVLTLTVSSNELCTNNETSAQMRSHFEDLMKDYLCNNEESCTVLSSLPDCDSIVVEKEEIDDRALYRISKREIKRKKKSSKSSGKVKIFVRVGRRLGIWEKNRTLSENIRRVKYELQLAESNEDIRRRFERMNINLDILDIDSRIRCPVGSVTKQFTCVVCPLGTFHDTELDRCQLCPIGSYNDRTGTSTCKLCPTNFSTRKAGRRSFADCKMQCPPGTAAKIKVVRQKFRSEQINKKSLMPFCRKCGPGEYQGYYDKTTCDKCPFNYTSLRASTSAVNCFPEYKNPCDSETNVCGHYGQCIVDISYPELYTCQCLPGFIGANCEYKLDLCYSGPCANNGICRYVNATSITCDCLSGYTGRFCELLKIQCTNSTCQNNGTCIEIDDKLYCECTPGYDGEYCQYRQDNCISNPCELGICQSTQEGYQCACQPGIIGKRCHLRPCDYFPCNTNAICVNLQNQSTTRNSYVCKCPIGLQGRNCTELIDPCELNPCGNTGICRAISFRQVNNRLQYQNGSFLSDDIYSQYDCECQPYFYGKNCEIFETPDFIVQFEKPTTRNFIKLKGPQKDIRDISFCVWLQTDDNSNYGTLLSYATNTIDNMLTFTDYSGFVLYVHGNHIVTDLVVNDGSWHFVCVTWSSINGLYEIYLDGTVYASGGNLSSNLSINGDGILILGQEQDTLGSSFSDNESFLGKISYLDIWDKILTSNQIREYYSSCEPYHGSLYSWTDFKREIVGDVILLESSFCKPCKNDLTIKNGYIHFSNNTAYYHCNNGFVLSGDSTRNCLRTSEWSHGSTFCEIVKCDAPAEVLNGDVEYKSTVYGSEVTYACNDGFEMIGSRQSTCIESGIWSNSPPVCKSIFYCPSISIKENAKIFYWNDKGTLNSSALQYPTNTYAEIFCSYERDEELFFICLKDGTWDGPKSACVLNLTTQEDLSVKSTSLNPSLISPIPIPSTSWIPIPDSPIMYEIMATTTELSTIYDENRTTTGFMFPTKVFLIELKSYFFHGCLSKIEKQSYFCSVAKNNNIITDLSNFEPPFTEEYQQMDVKLYTLLDQNYNNFSMAHDNDLIDNILYLMYYGTKNPSSEDVLQSEMELSLRFFLCFYIDTIIWDYDFIEEPNEQSFSDDANGRMKKILIKYLGPIQFRYQQFRVSGSTAVPPTKEETTSEFSINKVKIAKECTINTAPDPPENGIIYSINVYNQTRVNFDTSKIRISLDLVPIGSEIFYGCSKDHFAMGNFISYCEEENMWSQVDYYCQSMSCRHPVVASNMLYAGQNGNMKRFKFGDKLQLQCIDGYKLRGDSWITCLHSGNWTPVAGECI